MSEPWLSVLLPVYNGAATLNETLASVVNQADGIEIILVDQGSQDGSLEIASAYQGLMNLRIVAAPENMNWVQNTNLALGLAQAPRASLLHQDDLWRPGRSALLRELFAENPDASLWLHSSEFVDEAGRHIGALSPAFGVRAREVASSEAMEKLLVQNTISLPSVAFPVSAARALGGLDETLWYTADWHLWLGLADQGHVMWSPKNASAFRLHGNSLTVTGSKDLNDFETQLAIPIELHAFAVSDGARERVMKLAKASNLLNVFLASVFHNQRRPFGPVLAAVFGLGPTGWCRFFRDTRILARLLPRLRLMRRR